MLAATFFCCPFPTTYILFYTEYLYRYKVGFYFLYGNNFKRKIIFKIKNENKKEIFYIHFYICMYVTIMAIY